MSLFEACRDAGIPQRLLIPVRPWDKPDERGNGAGKAPAFVRDGGVWDGLYDWEKCNTPWETCLICEKYGGNVGLVLGTGSEWTFAALDMDLDPGQEEHRDRLISLLASLHPDKAVVIRETRSYRALILVRVNSIAEGRKLVFYLTHSGKKIGKIELLTTHQQCVIAGRHPEAGPIRWHLYGSGEYSPIPVLPPHILAFPDQLDLAEHARSWLEKAAEHGYWFEAHAAGAGAKMPDASLVPEWLTPDILVKFIDDTPNPIQVDRDQYVWFMEGIAACRRGLIARYGPLPTMKDEQLRTHAAEWAAKWPGNALVADPFSAEREKIDNDWFKDRGNFSTGWQRLIALAQEFGYKDARHMNAAYDFRNSFQAAPLTESSVAEPARLAEEVDVPFIPGSELSDSVVESELRIRQGLDQQAAFLEGIGWIGWDGRIGGWRADDKEGSTIYNAVRFGIQRYLAPLVTSGITAGMPLTKGEITGALSTRKIGNVMDMLKHSLSRSGTEDRAKYHMQTPGGTYDLRTLNLVSAATRKNLFDTRYTAVVPIWEEKETPLFDSLIMGLADQNPEVANWLWHYLGYSLLGDPREECFVVIWGPGKNGKSKLAAIMDYMLGDYYVPLESKVLLASGKDMHPTHLNTIRGKRCAIASEISMNEKWNESILKALTGGDKISARNMNKDASTFRPEMGLMVMTNEIPSFPRITPAVLRRFRLIGTTWTPPVPDTSLEEKLKQYEAPYILAKLMRYAQKVYNPNGAVHEHIKLPPEPEAMMRVRDTTLSEKDPFYAWLRAECTYGPDAVENFEPIEELLGRFDAYMKRSGSATGVVGDNMNESQFKNALKRMGVCTADQHGNPIRRTIRAGADQKTVAVATGVRLKVKAA